jgi:hypothetical protein
VCVRARVRVCAAAAGGGGRGAFTYDSVSWTVKFGLMVSIWGTYLSAVGVIRWMWSGGCGHGGCDQEGVAKVDVVR